MLQTTILIAALLFLPALVQWTEKRSRLVRWVSPLIICYLIGIAAGNIPGLLLNQKILEISYIISVFLAIPLLLFSANFTKMKRQILPSLFSFFLGVAGVVICALLAFLIFRGSITGANAVAGMMIGVYTGGTPNMSAIGIALGVDEEVFLLLNSADIFFTGIYFFFLLTAGKWVLGRVLPGYRNNGNPAMQLTEDQHDAAIRGKRILHILSGLGLAIAVCTLSIGISYLVTGDLNIPIVILGVTTLGIAASFHSGIRNLPGTFGTANYLLLVFALAMGSMANFSELLEASSKLFYFCGFVVFGSVLLHYLLAFLFRVDRDTLIITSTAAIYGPQFIGPVARAIGNREIIAVGITLGLIGYAVGNYLGLGIAFVLK